MPGTPGLGYVERLAGLQVNDHHVGGILTIFPVCLEVSVHGFAKLPFRKTFVSERACRIDNGKASGRIHVAMPEDIVLPKQPGGTPVSKNFIDPPLSRRADRVGDHVARNIMKTPPLVSHTERFSRFVRTLIESDYSVRGIFLMPDPAAVEDLLRRALVGKCDPALIVMAILDVIGVPILGKKHPLRAPLQIEFNRPADPVGALHADQPGAIGSKAAQAVEVGRSGRLVNTSPMRGGVQIQNPSAVLKNRRHFGGMHGDVTSHSSYAPGGDIRKPRGFPRGQIPRVKPVNPVAHLPIDQNPTSEGKSIGVGIGDVAAFP